MRILREVLLHNLVIKAVSFILALLTWMYIAGQLYKEEAAKTKEAPSIIEVSGEKMIVKRLPIYVNIDGSPAKGYEVVLDKIVVNPSYSVVAGPAQISKDLSYIITEPVNIEGATGRVRKSVRLMSVPQCKVDYEGPVNVVIPVAKERRKR